MTFDLADITQDEDICRCPLNRSVASNGVRKVITEREEHFRTGRVKDINWVNLTHLMSLSIVPKNTQIVESN